VDYKKIIGKYRDELMKILYAGNLVNVGYYHTGLCREKGLDMELLIQKNPEPNSDPF
jgi:hypothetical protein